MSPHDAQSQAGRPLHICYLLQQFPLPTETFAVSDIAALMAQGHEVSLFTLKPPRSNEAALAEMCGVPPQLRISRPGVGSAWGWPRLLWKHRRAVGSLLAAIRRHGRSDHKAAAQALVCLPRLVEIADRIGSESADVTHAFWSRHVGLVLPLLESIGSPSLRTAFVGAYDLVANDFILDLTADAAAILFSHAEVNRSFLERKAAPGTGIEIIHRGVPLMEQPGEGGRDPFRWITASALVPAKNVDAVIRGFAAAQAQEPRLKLDIFGDGPDRPRLERIAVELGCEDAVNFRGHIPRDRLFAEMTGAALFLLLSIKPSERLPNVVKEALWAGCSVVSSNSEGIEELIPDSSVGFVVDPSDAQALADVLRGLVEESEEAREQRRSKAREIIRSRFSSDASMAAYVAAWAKRLPA